VTEKEKVKMFKKIVCTLGALAFIVSIHNAFADDRASLYLAGEIDVVTDLFINPTIGTTDLLDLINGETARQVADVDETSNNGAGYQITMESVNNARLMHNNGIANTTYTISYDGAAAIAPGPIGTPVLVKTSGILSALTTDNSLVLIDVVPNPLAVAGAYTDTLIFNMVAL